MFIATLLIITQNWYVCVCVYVVSVYMWAVCVLRVRITISLLKIGHTNLSISIVLTFNAWIILVNFMTEV